MSILTTGTCLTGSTSTHWFAGCILIGEPKEMRVYYGKDNPIAELKATDLVDASDAELAEIAMEQYKAIYKTHPLDKAVQRQELRVILEATK